MHSKHTNTKMLNECMSKGWTREKGMCAHEIVKMECGEGCLILSFYGHVHQMGCDGKFGDGHVVREPNSERGAYVEVFKRPGFWQAIGDWLSSALGRYLVNITNVVETVASDTNTLLSIHITSPHIDTKIE